MSRQKGPRAYRIRGAKTNRKVKVYFPKNGTRSKTKAGTRWVKDGKYVE